MPDMMEILRQFYKISHFLQIFYGFMKKIVKENINYYIVIEKL